MVSEKVVVFGRVSFLTGVIAAQSRIMSAKVEASPKLGSVQKKRHGHNFDFSGPASNQHGTNPIAYLILVHHRTTGGGVLFPAGVPFSTENAIKTAFSKVYSVNININLHIFRDENIR